MRKSVIIVAGGSGTRMKQSIPKQFIEILEKPVVVHTIEAFLLYDPSIDVVLVLPEAHFDTWLDIKASFLPNQSVRLAKGGHSRFQSVKSGLDQVSADLVAIHDAVRPIISPSVIAASFATAAKHGSGVAMVPLKDSIRSVRGPESKSEDRSSFQLVQTPQTFKVVEIKSAFEQGESSSFTDDASVYEAAGMKVHISPGDYSNIKITTPEDLKIAEVLLEQLKK